MHGSHGAGFSGTVNPEGSPTQVFWQYGLDKRYTKAGGRGPNYTNATPRRQVGSDASAHPESISVGELVPNALYHVRMVAYNGNGTAYGVDQTFITGKGGPPGPPVIGKSFDIAPVSGIVYIVIGHKLIPLTVNTKIPAGSIIDALHGSLSLKSGSGKKGKLYQGIFGGAVFRLTQETFGANRGFTTLALVEGTFKGAPTYASCKARAARSKSRRSHSAQLACPADAALALQRQVPQSRPLRGRNGAGNAMDDERPVRRHPDRRPAPQRGGLRLRQAVLPPPAPGAQLSGRPEFAAAAGERGADGAPPRRRRGHSARNPRSGSR